MNREVGPGSTHYALSPSDYGPPGLTERQSIIVSVVKDLAGFVPGG